jgi:hypothetical protein
MKMRSLASFFTTAALTLTAVAAFQAPSKAQEPSFHCGVWLNGPNAGTPVTYARTPIGAIPIINWVSNHFTGSGYTPERRCQEVSGRFQSAYDQGTLNYITTGYKNGQPVVCTSSSNGGPCSMVLFTLKPGSDASRTVQQLFDIRNLASGPLYESEDRIYLDMNAFLEEGSPVDPSAIQGAGASSAPTAPSQAPATPTPQPSGGSSGGGGTAW